MFCRNGDVHKIMKWKCMLKKYMFVSKPEGTCCAVFKPAWWYFLKPLNGLNQDYVEAQRKSFKGT